MSALWQAADGPYLALYLVTLAVHAVFVSYLVGGTLFVLLDALARRRDRRAGAPPASPGLAAHVASWLPLTMGGAITAGVAPLLFLQILYQRAFYTSNLLLGPTWGLMIPALITGFYLLYLHKSRPSLRPALVLGLALACFLLVAALWSFNHAVMTAPAAWAEAYRDSAVSTYGGSFARRLPLWLGGMLAQFALLATWQARRIAATATTLRALAGVALAGRALSAIGAWSLGWHHAWHTPLVAALIAVTLIDLALWFALWRAAASRASEPAVNLRVLGLLTATTAIALLAAIAVREQERLPQLRDLPTSVRHAGGAWLFALFAGLAIVALVAIIRTVRRAIAAPLASSTATPSAAPPTLTPR